MFTTNSRRAGLIVALAGMSAAASTAEATWSIILVDTRTREVGIASATCLTGFDLRQGSPVVVTGVGAAAAQSFVESLLVTRTYIRDRLLEGVDPTEIIAGLPSVDANHQLRQYGIADVFGRGTTFTGSFAGAWAGGVSGQFTYTYAGKTGTMAYAIQGNVLTGPSVVADALAAAQNTAGDLPARLMAAMEAARAQGGDGRCSCDPESPTACGAPPASFATTAQIGYVIVARLGDSDRCGGVYPGSGGPGVGVIATGDVLGSPLGDVAVTTLGGGVLRYENSSDRRVALPAFTHGAPTLAPSVATSVGPSLNAMAIGDLSGGPLAETVVGRLGTAPIAAIDGSTGGALSTVGLATDVRDLIVSDVNRDGQNDVVALTGGGVLRVYRNALGVFSEVASVTLGQLPADMTAMDVDGDGDDDFAVAITGVSQVVVVENRTVAGGAVDLFARPAVVLAGPARNIVTGDFNGDNDDDLAVTLNNAGNEFQIVSNSAGVLTARTRVAARLPPACVASGDVTGDGIDDLLIGGSGGLATHRGVAGSANGVAFSAGSGLRVGGVVGLPVSIAVHDVDSDGDNDVLAHMSLGRLAVLENRGAPAGQPFGAAGTWVSTTGCAEGDYFLSLNVANVPTSAPDVVPILRQQFDAWRSNLTSKVDGVQSVVSVPSLTTASPARYLFITLRDWQGQVVVTPVTLTIDRTGAAGAFVLGAVEQVEPGTFRVLITPGPVPVVEQLRISVQATGGRPVVLMPLPTIAIGAPCSDIDFNNNTVFPEDQDVMDFFRVLTGDECAACDGIDFNNNGVFPEDQDVIDFLNVLAGAAC